MTKDFAVSSLRKIVPNATALTLLKLYTPFLILLLFVAWQQRIPVHVFTRDIFSITKFPAYTGLISNLGILIWCFSWAVCTFTVFLIKPIHNVEKQIKNFIKLSGLISLWLMLDDLLMLHEQWLPYLLRISEDIVIVAELIWVIFHLIYFRKIILKFTQYKVLAIALLLFIFSMSLDLLPLKIDYIGFKSDWFFLLEDGSKLMGIITWCFYFCCVCYQQLIKAQNFSTSQSGSPSFSGEIKL